MALEREELEQEQENSPSLRDTVAAAFDEHVEEPDSGDDREAPVNDPERGTESEPGEGSEPAPGRDPATGRFTKGAGKGSDSGAPGKKAGAEVPAPTAAPAVPVQQPPEDRAPQSWKPATRELWAGLPPAVKAEVARREREVSVALQQAAEHRRTAEELGRTVQPYEHFIRGAGHTPMQTIDNLLQTAAALRTLPKWEQAGLVANLIRGHAVDVNLLAQHLQGQPQPPQGYQPQQPMDVRAAVRQELQQAVEGARQAQLEQYRAEADAELENFAENHEFFQEVREDMADLIESHAKRGNALSYEDAYNRAVKAHPEVAPVLEQREAAKRAANPRGSTSRARAAASSVKSTPAVAATKEPTTLREQIAAAFDGASGRV